MPVTRGPGPRLPGWTRERVVQAQPHWGRPVGEPVRRPCPPLTDGPAQQGEASPDFLPRGVGGRVFSHPRVAELASLGAPLFANCVSLIFLLDL